MKITAKQYAQALFESVKDKKQTEAKRVINNFARVLIMNNQSSKLPEIINYFNRFWNDYYQIAEAEIISAHQLTHETLNYINSILKNKFNKDLIINQKIDRKLIGGFILRADGQLLDLSLYNKLKVFKQLLSN